MVQDAAAELVIGKTSQHLLTSMLVTIAAWLVSHLDIADHASVQDLSRRVDQVLVRATAQPVGTVHHASCADRPSFGTAPPADAPRETAPAERTSGTERGIALQNTGFSIPDDMTSGKLLRTLPRYPSSRIRNGANRLNALVL